MAFTSAVVKVGRWSAGTWPHQQGWHSDKSAMRKPWCWPISMKLNMPGTTTLAAEVTHVEHSTPDHLHWTSLDIDLCVASIRHPEAFPLVAKG